MKRILINATQNEEIRVALCKGNHLYDFDLENRTREQKKSNIYKGHVTRVEPSLEAVFVEYGSQRQGFLPIREISSEYLSGNPRDENIKKLIKEGDELIVQVEKEERGNKGAALSTYVSLAGRYLVLMPNNPRGGGISRQISGKLREDMRRMLGNLDLAKGMSVIIRTAGIGKTQEDLQHDLNHLLNIWQAIQEQNQKYPSPRLVHQEAGVVTRAVRDYLRDDIAEIWIDNENAYIEAAGFIDAVMPKQAEKLRKYTDYEPMFSRFNVEKQIETAYQREVRLPSGGSIVIDQTEALVSIDINSAKSTKGSDVAETAFHTNLEAADEIARQLRLRDMGGLIVIDFIDMNDNKNQKEVEKRLIDATKYDRARVQFGDISKFGLMEMSRQRLRPSLEESTGYICPRCHGNGMIRDLRSLSLSIMRQIEQIALKERQGEVQAEVPTDIAAFLLNEKRDSLVYLEQDSGTRITILPHAHLESPNFKLHFNRDGFAPTSYERITDTQQQEHSDLGYDVNWQTAEKERPEQQPTRQPRKAPEAKNSTNHQPSNSQPHNQSSPAKAEPNHSANEQSSSTRVPQPNPQNNSQNSTTPKHPNQQNTSTPTSVAAQAVTTAQPKAVAWLSNLFAQAPQAQITPSISSHDAAEAIEALVNAGAQSLGTFGQVDNSALNSNALNTHDSTTANKNTSSANNTEQNDSTQSRRQTNDNRRQQPSRSSNDNNNDNNEERPDNNNDDKRKRQSRKPRPSKSRQRRDPRDDTETVDKSATETTTRTDTQDNRRHNERSRNNDTRDNNNSTDNKEGSAAEQTRPKRKPHSQRNSRGKLERGEAITANSQKNQQQATENKAATDDKSATSTRRNQNQNEVTLQVNEAPAKAKAQQVVHLSLDDSKSENTTRKPTDKPIVEDAIVADTIEKMPKQAETSVAVDSTQQHVASDSHGKPSEAVTTVDTQQPTAPTVTATDSKSTESNSTEANTEVSAVTDNRVKPESKVAEKEQAVISEAVVADKPSASTEIKDATPVAKLVTPIQKLTTDTQQAQDNADNTTTPTSKHDDLFAERYVTANKFGKASNDPRVVRQQIASAAPAPVVVTETAAQKTVAIKPTIRGTVGEFIHATLPKSGIHLADKGVIQSFIDAIAVYHQQAQNSERVTPDTEIGTEIGTQIATKAENTDSHNDPDRFDVSAFNFSNYGYEPLDADYLARFETMTQATSQIAVAQGKTEVMPRAISKRASNDPRGQHPDYAQQEPEHVLLSVPDVQAKVQTEVQAELPEHVSITAPSDADGDNHTATALTTPVNADEVTSESSQLLEADRAIKTSLTAQAVDVTSTLVEESAKEDFQAGKSKTTIASYKNMIENVAEQLSPQKGVFNLTAAKVPKARSRKPRTEPKKPTQIDSTEAASSENSDLNSNNLDSNR